MKITLLCGSPRPKDSNSMYLLEGLRGKLEGCDIALCRTSEPVDALLEHLADSAALVAAFPLYADSIPSNVLDALSAIQAGLPGPRPDLKAYAVVNSGFYDAVQNRIAIDMFWAWCAQCGLARGYALGVGAGEMARAAPLGQGPSANPGRALGALAEGILAGASGEDVFVEPNFPRFLYKAAAHMGWRKQGKGNGLSPADLRAKIT